MSYVSKPTVNLTEAVKQYIQCVRLTKQGKKDAELLLPDFVQWVKRQEPEGTII